MNGKLKLHPMLVSGIIVSAVVVVGAAAWLLRDRWNSQPGPAEEPDSGTPVAAAEPNVVELSKSKLAAAKLKTVVVGRSDLQHGHTVPGRLVYDETRHVAVKTPVGGVLTKVLVQPGDRVAAGDVLAWVTSPEVGTARADVLKRQSERDLAGDWFEQKQLLANAVEQLVADLEKRPAFESIHKAYASRMLGDYREKLISSYSRFLLADSMRKNLAGLNQSGAIAGKRAMQQEKELRAAEAALRAACEQSKLDARRECRLARAAAVDAEQRLTIARQHLASLLLLPETISGTKSPPGYRSDAKRKQESDLKNLSRLVIVAPIPGTIENREFTAGERVKQSDSLFILAETSRLWIRADLRESEWSALNLNIGQKLAVTSPAFPGKTLTARLRRLGRTVSPETNAIPLIAEIDNRDGKLRPGLFMRVTLPVSAERDTLFVPDSAVLQHEGASFVFVEIARGRYRRTNVKTGIAGQKRVAVLDGLREGSRVVTKGAFLLKSELLLEREE